MIDNQRIDYKVRFEVPFKSENDSYLSLEAKDGNSTLVKWGFSGRFPYPLNIMSLVMDMDDQVGGDFEEGLNNLKSILETK